MEFFPCKKIDTHLHLTFAPMEKGKGMYLSSFLEMLPHLEELNIRKGFALSGGESAVPFGSNDMACSIAAADPEHYAWMCNLDPVELETVYGRLKACKDRGAVGIGELMINKPLNDPFLRALFEAAGALKLPVTFHMSPEEGFSYGVVDRPGLPLLEQALADFPETVFVGHSQCFWIEISGDAPTDRNGRQSYGKGPVAPGGRVPELFEKYPNLYGDLSANSAGTALMRDEAFGLAFLEKFRDRLFFATDMLNTDMRFPLGSWLDTMAAEGKLSLDAYEKICWKNASRVYGV